MKEENNKKFIIFILVALLIMGGIVFANVLSFREVEKQTVNQLLENKIIETKFAASQIESHILNLREELIKFSKFPIAENSNILECSLNPLDGTIEPKETTESLLMADKSGNIVGCSSSDYLDYLGLNIKDKDYFKIPWETNEPYVTSVLRQGTSRQIIVSVPLFETVTYTPYPNFLGKFKGVLFSVVDVNKLYYLYLLPFVNTEQGSFFIAEAEGDAILLESEKVSEYGDIKKLIPKKGDKLQYIKDFDNKGATIVTSSDVIVGKEHWKLIMLAPLENIGKDIRKVQNGHLITLSLVAMVICIILIFSFVLYRSKEKMKRDLDRASVTLEKLGVTAQIEDKTYTPADVILEPKKVYLFKDVEENQGFDLFISSLNLGWVGLAIVREDPRVLRKKYNLHKTAFIWLTDHKVEGIPCEKKLEPIIQVVLEFLRENRKCVVFIEGIDYLILQQGFEEVIKKVHTLKDSVSLHDSIIILSVNGELLDSPKLKVLESLTVDVYGRDLKQKVELTEIEKEILRLINDKNNRNELISFKDITQRFNITKPTTRVKIRKLLALGLIQVETNGRFKSLRITSRGRRII